LLVAMGEANRDRVRAKWAGSRVADRHVVHSLPMLHLWVSHGKAVNEGYQGKAERLRVVEIAQRCDLDRV